MQLISGPSFKERPFNLPIKGEIYHVGGTHEENGYVYYYLAEFSRKCVYDARFFADIEDVTGEIQEALSAKCPSKQKEELLVLND